MSLDDRLLCAQEGCAAVLLAVHLVLEVGHAVLQQQIGQLAAQVLEEHSLEHPQQHLGDALGELEDDVAGEAVADDHVHVAVRHVTGLDIAHEADARDGLEQLMGFSEHGGTLALLGTVVGQRHAGGGAALHLVHIAAAHDGESGQHLGAALDIRAAVQQQIRLIFGRHHGGQRRALDAPQGADDEACAHMERAGAAGRDEGVAFALFEHIQAHDDGGILLRADGPGRLVAHLDGLSAVHQLDAVQRDVVVGGGLADKGLVAHADELDAVFLHGSSRAFQHGQGGVVAAHHIYDDLHRFHPFCQQPSPLSLASLASSPKGGATGVSVKPALDEQSSIFRKQ